MSRAVRSVAGALACLALAGCGAGENPAHSASALAEATLDLEGVAHDVVVRSARIQEGDHVLIEGTPADLELMENIAVHARRLGAHPAIGIYTDRLTRRMYDDVPEQYDDQPDTYYAALRAAADVAISLGSGSPADLLAHVPERRFAARRNASAHIFRNFAERGGRTVDIGNGLYPSQDAARRFGMSQRELAQLFWDGVQADPEQMTATGTALVDILNNGSSVRVTDTRGTDLTFRIERGTARLSNGVIPPAGTPGYRAVWLPAGEVFIPIDAGSANGHIATDHFWWEGRELVPLRIQLVNGAITSLESTGDIKRFREAYELAPAGRERIGLISIGINPSITSHRVLSWVTYGMTTLQFGDNIYAGGDLDTDWGMRLHMPGTTVRVDDRVIIENGVLKL